MDPLVGLLTPAVVPQNLYSIQGPVYVEPAGLQPPFLQHVHPQIIGSSVVGPPVLGPPIASAPLVSAPVYVHPSPSPYNPYAPSHSPLQLLYDEQQDEISPPHSRRSNSNVQSGIQQFGDRNSNLQGNIQQSRRSSQHRQQASHIGVT